MLGFGGGERGGRFDLEAYLSNCLRNRFPDWVGSEDVGLTEGKYLELISEEEEGPVFIASSLVPQGEFRDAGQVQGELRERVVIGDLGPDVMRLTDPEFVAFLRALKQTGDITEASRLTPEDLLSSTNSVTTPISKLVSGARRVIKLQSA